MKNYKMAIICLLTGYLGVHKFMERKTGMGILYLFTFGLCGIGWIVDTVKYFAEAFRVTAVQTSITNAVQEVKDMTPDEKAEFLRNIKIDGPGISLADGEICYYAGGATAFHTKDVVVGKKGGGAGVSIRVAKGVRYHTGSGASQNVRGTVVEKSAGRFYVTNKRIILLAPKFGFNLPAENVVSFDLGGDTMRFYDGSGKCYSMMSNDIPRICQVMTALAK